MQTLLRDLRQQISEQRDIVKDEKNLQMVQVFAFFVIILYFYVFLNNYCCY
jgi:hypothetical protein